MQQLSGLDAAFLGMESPTVHGHVGSLCVLDPSTAPAPLTVDRLRGLVAERLHLIPAFRRRLAQVPLGLDHPWWVETSDLDLTYHVREVTLHAPGDDGLLADQVVRIHARHLDRSRPLWELHLVHGLADGRQAVVLKIHHAAIDGVTGNALVTTIMDTSPEGQPVPEGSLPGPERMPGAGELLLRSAFSLAGHPLRAARLGVGLARSLPRLAARPLRPPLPSVDRLLGRDADAVLPSRGLRAPDTPFNAPVTADRRFAFTTLPLDGVRQAKARAGTTVNDVFVAICAGALRRWLLRHAALPDGPLVAAVPVSVARPGETATNRVSMMMCALPTHLADPHGRLAAVHDALRAAKEVHGALPATLLTDVAQFAAPALLGQAARLSARLRVIERVSPFNLIISNVPGPQQPLYWAGARLVGYHPISAVMDGQGLNITVLSLDGGMHVGVLADRDLVPDADLLTGWLHEELAALLEHTPAPSTTT